jgi:hypothetical protein
MLVVSPLNVKTEYNFMGVINKVKCSISKKNIVLVWSYAATCNLLRSFRQACHAAHHLSPEHHPTGRWFCAMLGQLQDPMVFHSNHWSVSFRKLHDHRGYNATRYQLMEQSWSLSVLASKVHTWPPASCTQITPTAWSQDYVNSMKRKGDQCTS